MTSRCSLRPTRKNHHTLAFGSHVDRAVPFSPDLSRKSACENPVRIAQIAPLTEAIPPKLYGGTERVISWLTDELVALGHEVVLFASGDSQTSAKLQACWPRSLRLDSSVHDPNALHIAMLELVRRQCHDFDLLHFHLDHYPFSLFSRQQTPFVTTLHGRLDLPEHQVVFATFPSIPVISISDAQRRPVPGAGWIRTIQHGLPGMSHFLKSFSARSKAKQGQSSCAKPAVTPYSCGLRCDSRYSGRMRQVHFAVEKFQQTSPSPTSPLTTMRNL